MTGQHAGAAESAPEEKKGFGGWKPPVRPQPDRPEQPAPTPPPQPEKR